MGQCRVLLCMCSTRVAGVTVSYLDNDVDVVVPAHVVEAHQAGHVLAAVQRAHPSGVRVQLWYLQPLIESVSDSCSAHEVRAEVQGVHGHCKLHLGTESAYPRDADSTLEGIEGDPNLIQGKMGAARAPSSLK